MSEFSSFERYLARVLSRFPYLKKISKYLYTRVSFVRYRKKRNVYLNMPVEAILEDGQSFFGYYDKSPESGTGQILVHSTRQTTQKTPKHDIPIDVVLLCPKKRELLRVATNAYNWQQGARLQWLTDDLFAFNDFDNGAYVSRLFSATKLAQVAKFPLPIQDGWKDEFFLSINYERLNALRPDYGYRNKPLLSRSELENTDNDGIWHCNMASSESRLIISLKKLADDIDKEDALHKLNHVSISPDGSCFIFLHRYLIKGRRHDRLCFSTVDGRHIKVLSDFGMVSHYCWLNPWELLCFLRGPNGQDGYWKIDVNNGNFSHLDVCQGLGDGHPSCSGNLVVTDSYPNKSRMQDLVLFDHENLKEQHLGSFFHSFKFSDESRCDLHPRFSKNGKHIYFDSVFEGRRKLYRISLD